MVGGQHSIGSRVLKASGHVGRGLVILVVFDLQSVVVGAVLGVV